MLKHFKFLLSLLTLIFVSARASAYDTSYDVATIESGTFIDQATVTPGKSTIGKWRAINPAINLSNRDPEHLYLAYDATIEEQNAGDAAVLNQMAAQIELTSSGTCDKNELTLDFKQSWKTGTHTYMVPFASAGNSGGVIDYSNVNYMRIYATSVPASFTGKVTMTIKNIRIVDNTTITRLPTIFSDGMLVQQKKPIPVWGFGGAGKNVTAKLLKGTQVLSTQTATIGSDGKWKVQFPAQNASYDSYKITVADNAGTNIEVNDILVGELWVAGGQSNMALSVGGLQHADSILNDAKQHGSKYFRFFYEPTYPYSNGSNRPLPMEPTSDIVGGYWGYGNKSVDVARVSAVAYLSMNELQKKLGIPVGFLYTPIGGSVIEGWIPRKELEENTVLVANIKSVGRYVAENGTTNNTQAVTGLYNQKVAPIAGINVAGTIWYQGESNSNLPQYYADEILTLKRGWERTFNFADGDMPFIFCQVCRWATDFDKPIHLAYLDEAMSDACARGKNMAILPLYDTNMSFRPNVVIHPTYKEDTGHRFFTSVYNKVYNTGHEYTAAVYKSHVVKDGKIVVTFDHVGTGLKTLDGSNEVRGFAIAGANGVYANATATITAKNQVTVSNPGITDPRNVTYAFSSWNFASNLANSEGIPAAPFRSYRSDNNIYYNPQDWTTADKSTFWTLTANADTTEKNLQTISGNYPTYTATNGTVAIDNTVKVVGLGSVKYTYNNGGGLVGPAFQNPATNKDYQTLVAQFEDFKAVTAQVKNPDARQKTVSVVLTSMNGDKYTSKETVTIPANADFTTVSFPLTAFVDANGKEVKPLANKIKQAKGFALKVNDNAAGTLYFDNFLFSGAAEPDFTVNAVVTSKQDIADLVSGYDKITVKMTLDKDDIAALRKYATESPLEMLDLTDAVFPNNEIPDSAFREAKQLKGVTIPASVTTIGVSAFDRCTALSNVVFADSKNSSLVEIKKFGFDLCTSLTSITMPASVETIGSLAFGNDTKLATVAFEEGSQLTTLDIRAFLSCTALSSVTLTSKVPKNTRVQVFLNDPVSTATLYVPAEYVDDYKAADQWKDFIIKEAPKNIDNPDDDNDNNVPHFDHFEAEGNGQARVFFTNVSGSLKPVGTYITSFEVAGADSVYHQAAAKVVSDNEVVVVCDEMCDQPIVNMRYIGHELTDGSDVRVDNFTTQPADLSKLMYPTYKNLLMVGYQGWFATPEDGVSRSWVHYENGGKFEPGHTCIDFFPDMTEYTKTYKTPFKYPDGSQVTVFSDNDQETLDLHFRWMKDYGIDGAMLQRFKSSVENLPESKVRVGKEIEAAKKSGRAFVLEYDLSGLDSLESVQKIIDDWNWMCDTYGLNDPERCPNYVWQNGKPVVGFFAVGMKKSGPDQYLEMFDKMRGANGIEGAISPFAGTGYYWRMSGIDPNLVHSDAQEYPRWEKVYKRCAIISPWAVGRYGNSAYYTSNKEPQVKEDLQWCKDNNVLYAPVAFPGFSWRNMHTKWDGDSAILSNDVYDASPRVRGTFFKTQLDSYLNMGTDAIFVAMFDEMDEGTAIFKCSTTSKTPINSCDGLPDGKFLSIDDDLGSDYYLKLAGAAASSLKK